MKERDVLLKDGDIVVEGKDVAVGDVAGQNVELLLTLEKGEIEEFPGLGAGLEGIVGDEDEGYWMREIREVLKGDGMEVERLKVDLDGGEIEINTKYR